MTNGAVAAMTAVNFGLLAPGVLLPVYTVEIDARLTSGLIPLPIRGTVYEQTRSILGTVHELWNSADYLVAFLILLFSVIVPAAKAAMLLGSIYASAERARRTMVRWVDRVGKWSMADVFVVAVFLAFLATDGRGIGGTAAGSAETPFGAVGVEFDMRVESSLETGFWFFLAYCLFSVAWTQVLRNRGFPQWNRTETGTR